MSRAKEIWILGATGRGRSAVARELAGRQLAPVLVARDSARLRELADTIPGAPRTLVVETFEGTVAELKPAISQSW